MCICDVFYCRLNLIHLHKTVLKILFAQMPVQRSNLHASEIPRKQDNSHGINSKFSKFPDALYF